MSKNRHLLKEIFVYILCLKLFVSCRGQAKEGDSCVNEIGITGKCIGINDCEPALKLIYERKSPVFCNTDLEENFNALVCCKMFIQTRENLSQRKSFEMCKKYYPGLFKPKNQYVNRKYVIQGRQALSKEFPHMAIIGYGDEDDINWLCGGSLISEKFVLTAAHCIHTNRGAPSWVRLGELDTASTTDDADPRDFKVVRAVSHPSYELPSNYHDIGLLQLDSGTAFTDYIKPACLVSDIVSSVTYASAIGWGKTEFGGSSSSHLMEATLVMVNNTSCKTFYKFVPKDKLSEGIVEDTQICAGGNSGKDTCQGDSGGPLQVRKQESFQSGEKVYDLIGITSFGLACGLAGRPGVYTKIPFYLDWIENIVWP